MTTLLQRLLRSFASTLGGQFATESPGQLLRIIQLKHPLVAVVDFGEADEQVEEDTRISGDYYCLLFKSYEGNNVRYGRQVVDFNNGSLMCIAPNQVLELETNIEGCAPKEGWAVFFHRDLIRNTPLSDRMKNYTFFSYETSESLHMSEKEKAIFYDCVKKLDSELQENIDITARTLLSLT